jgi:hypothetical protein
LGIGVTTGRCELSFTDVLADLLGAVLALGTSEFSEDRLGDSSVLLGVFVPIVAFLDGVPALSSRLDLALFA